jgi:hypothetical protein
MNGKKGEFLFFLGEKIQKNIFFAAILWVCVFSLSLSINFSSVFAETLYFLILSISLIMAQKKRASKKFFAPLFRNWFVLLSILFFHISTYLFLTYFFIRPSDLPSNFQISFLSVDRFFLIQKPFEVLWQQLLLVWLLTILKKNNIQLKKIILVFVFLFGFLHILMIREIPIFFGLYFTIFAIIASFLFPLFLEKKKNGIIYNYGFHLLFYDFSALFFWTIFY